MHPSEPSRAQRTFSHVLQQCRAAFRHPREEERFEAAGEAAGNLLDGEYAALDGTPESDKIDCKPGCNFCCYRVIPVDIPEVLRTAAYITEHLSDEQISALKQRLYVYERLVARNFGHGLSLLRPKCPLLVDGLCSAYEARPLVCRGTFSFEVEKCEEAKRNPLQHRGAQRQIPSSGDFPVVRSRIELAMAAQGAMDQALGESGLPAGTHDFARALRIALENPETTKEWLEEEINNFGPALVRPPETLNRPPAADPPQRNYAPGEPASGAFNMAGLALPMYVASMEGNLPEALTLAQGKHPAYALWRIRVPYTYSSGDELIEWREYFRRAMHQFAESKFDPRQAYDGLASYCPHELCFQQLNNRELLSELGQTLANRVAARAMPELSQPIEKPRRPGKIRVGYISRNMRYSSVAPWALGWIMNHGEDIESYAYNLAEQPDNTSLKFKQYATHYFHLSSNHSALDRARLIKTHDLDLLVFLDVGAEPRLTQFATLRLARNQAGAWGGPETSGLPTMDYYLSAEYMEASNGEEHYSEKLVRLPGMGVYYLRDKHRPSTLIKSDFGLDDGPLYVSVQHPAKFAPEWDELYKRINEATGRPVVMVERRIRAAPTVCRRFDRKGIKYVLLPHLNLHDYLALMKIADVVLDTPGWNGGVTTIQALDMGTPVVTLPTDLKRGRQSVAMLKAANAPGLIADSLEAYVSLVTNENLSEATALDLQPQGMYNDLHACRAFDDFLRSLLD